MAARLELVAPRVIAGQAASAGIACGPAHVVVEPAQQFPPQVSAALESDSLTDAVRAAVAELEALMGRSDPESAEILDFQIEMLLDEEILELALIRVSAGDSAALAWAGGLDTYIADIETSGDSVFSARAADVVDIKNRVLAILTGRPVSDFPEGSIFVGKDIAPSLFLAHDWSKGGGIALSGGSIVSHVALLARAKSVPMVVGLGAFAVASDEPVLVDGIKGWVTVNPPADATWIGPAQALATAPVNREASQQLQTTDGQPIGLWLNINDAADLAWLDIGPVNGIGLVRTEFLLSMPGDAIDEERQVDLYRRVMMAAAGRPVTIRMLDLGGDKAMPGLGGAEDTSFLGVRGTRFLLARPEIARAQARALMRASLEGDLRVMLPMVTVPSEVSAMTAIYEEEAMSLARRGIAHRLPPLGIMVEVPATALTLDLFTDAKFFSFGTNDLAQYLAAAARDNPIVAPLHAEATEALVRLLKLSVALAAEAGIPVSVCGDMAGDPDRIAALLACGFRDFSMAPSRLAAVGPVFAGLKADGTPLAGEV